MEEQLGMKIDTSTIETITADIIANEWPAENVGGPHWRGYGNINLLAWKETWEFSKIFKHIRRNETDIFIIPWGSRYQICSVCTTTILCYDWFMPVSSTGSQDNRIDPNNCDTNQHWKTFKDRDVPKWPHML